MIPNIRFSLLSEGNSMYPLLQNGDIVEYEQVRFSEVKVNDIVLVYNPKSSFVTHRIIYKTHASVVTRGDNNPLADKVIKKGQIWARARRFKRKGKWHRIQDVYANQSLLYLHEMSKLAAEMKRRNIPHVFLKGVLVSLKYENTIPKRIYADCDLLVKRNNCQDIEKAFETLGYRYAGKLFPATKKKNKFSQPEISYVKVVKGVPVVFDVHFEPVFLMTQLEGMNLLYKESLLQSLGEEMITNGKNVRVKGMNFFLPSPTDQILYLILHIFHHNFVDSVRYSLLDSVIQKSISRTMWKELKERIQKYHLQGYSYLTLLLLKKYFKTPIPPSFLRSISPSWTKKQASLLLLKRINIFNQDARLKAGIERFVLIILLSPEPMMKKMLIFFHPDTLRSVLFIIRRKLRKSSRQKHGMLVQ